MVGVAGRSKACITCRRRRINCDTVRPNCGQCVRSNRVCQGYDCFPVFINRTRAGLERRQPLEEVKPRAPNAAPWVSAGSSLPQQMHAEAAWDEQFLSRFLEIYGISGHQRPSEMLITWIRIAVQIANPDVPLRLSLRALAMTRVGRISKDERLLAGGTKIYGQALRELQKALLDSKQTWEDETLVAAKALLLHELFESSSHSLGAWNAHLSGVTRMIMLRGPQLLQSPIAQAAVENHRYTAMIQSLHFRERNPLARTEWRSRQLGVSSFDDFQSLIDLGFDVGALAEDLDLLLNSSKLQYGTITTTSLLGAGKALDCELQAWYDELSRKALGPMFWDAPQLLTDKGNIGGPTLEVPLNFRSPSIAELLTNFWSVRLLLLVAILKLHGIGVRPESQSHTANTVSHSHGFYAHGQHPGPQPSYRTVSEILPSQLVPGSPSPLDVRNLAILITRSTTFCLSESVGEYLLLRFLFPIRVALVTFENSTLRLRNQYGPNHSLVKEAEQYQVWCHSCYEMLVKERQVGYARDLEKYPSRWQNPQD